VSSGKKPSCSTLPGITATSPSTIDHRPPIAPYAKIHPALEHPNDLLVRMLMRSGMCACVHFPPHDHSLFPGKDTPFNFIDDALPRQSRKCAEA
jgi:hypothetical protein